MTGRQRTSFSAQLQCSGSGRGSSRIPDALGLFPAPTSLLELPTELLFEIISYYRDPFTFISPLLGPKHGVQERQEAAQDSEAYSFRHCGRYSMARSTVFKSDTRTIQIRTHIDAALVPTQMKTVFLFLEFLRALPNLVGLQIHHLQSNIMPLMMKALKDVVFPKITALCVPDWSALVLFKSFPNVTTLACPSIHVGSVALPAAQIHFPRLKALAGLRLSKPLIHGLLRDFPALRAISISSTIASESTDFSLLKSFRRLARLSFVHEDLQDFLLLDALISRGAELLRESDSSEARVLTVWSYNVHEEFDAFPRVVSVPTR
ncbi:hypothetical protein B0H17DRAFT_1135990 [Mycena rosella]|uniref:F-box domain-containing protein n=1 Tax=Mycena rosella TaxID=1033263 RepID=A0AAD7DC26_MYCRO|nr:hypothetical protein B0H17DRAFT_1135990 [Mycena rosella]